MLDDTGIETWRVDFTSKADKQAQKLPADMRDRLNALTTDLIYHGPEQSGWRNYGMITGAEDVHHCHLNSGRPRYVVVWEVLDRAIRIMEICFVGPHGSVNYSRFK